MKMYWLSMWSDCCFNGDFSAKRFTIVFRYLPLNDVFYYLTHECRQGECLVEEVDIYLKNEKLSEEVKDLEYKIRSIEKKKEELEENMRRNHEKGITI